MHKYKPPSTWGVEIPQLSELSSPFEALRYITESLPPPFSPVYERKCQPYVIQMKQMWFKGNNIFNSDARTQMSPNGLN